MKVVGVNGVICEAMTPFTSDTVDRLRYRKAVQRSAFSCRPKWITCKDRKGVFATSDAKIAPILPPGGILKVVQIGSQASST